jgi:hypothetical protein
VIIRIFFSHSTMNIDSEQSQGDGKIVSKILPPNNSTTGKNKTKHPRSSSNSTSMFTLNVEADLHCGMTNSPPTVLDKRDMARRLALVLSTKIHITVWPPKSRAEWLHKLETIQTALNQLYAMHRRTKFAAATGCNKQDVPDDIILPPTILQQQYRVLYRIAAGMEHGIAQLFYNRTIDNDDDLKGNKQMWYYVFASAYNDGCASVNKDKWKSKPEEGKFLVQQQQQQQQQHSPSCSPKVCNTTARVTASRGIECSSRPPPKSKRAKNNETAAAVLVTPPPLPKIIARKYRRGARPPSHHDAPHPRRVTPPAGLVFYGDEDEDEDDENDTYQSSF